MGAVGKIRACNPNVFGTLVRNKNGNVVVMEGLVAQERLQSISFYWLDLEPSYRQQARRKGKPHDRDEFSMWDHKAYGFTETRVSPTRIDITLNQLPQYVIRVEYRDRRVVGHVTYEGQTYTLVCIKVEEGTGWIPRVARILARVKDGRGQEKNLTVYESK